MMKNIYTLLSIMLSLSVFAQDSIYRLYYESGKIMWEVECQNSEKNGLAKEYNENGNIILEIEFVDDKANGFIKEYNDKGILITESRYEDNIPNGLVKTYSLDGKLTSTYNMVDGKKNGRFEEYDENERLKRVREFKNDISGRISIYFYDENGALESKKVYEDELMKKNPLEEVKYFSKTKFNLDSIPSEVIYRDRNGNRTYWEKLVGLRSCKNGMPNGDIESSHPYHWKSYSQPRKYSFPEGARVYNEGLSSECYSNHGDVLYNIPELEIPFKGYVQLQRSPWIWVAAHDGIVNHYYGLVNLESGRCGNTYMDWVAAPHTNHQVGTQILYIAGRKVIENTGVETREDYGNQIEHMWKPEMKEFYQGDGGWNPKEINWYEIKSLVELFLEDIFNNNRYYGSPSKLITSLSENKEEILRNTKAIFEPLEEGKIALAYGFGQDDKILIKIDPENWQKSSLEKRLYVIYHELGHDVLNLDHGEGGKMMFNFVDKNYTLEEFVEDRDYMFKSFLGVEQ